MVCLSENMQNNEPIRTSSVIGLCRVDLSSKSISSLSLAENPQFLELLQNLGLRIIDFDDKSALCWPITLKIRILVLFAYIFRWTYNLLYLGITVGSCKLESSNISDYYNVLKDQLSVVNKDSNKFMQMHELFKIFRYYYCRAAWQPGQRLNFAM